ncbi:mRNA metabolism modulator [Enterobacter phage vB_EhoM-IME523]|uniref:mRNA metabolism modulator n=1 Tax=Enterobacter phage vB_EhoM-IME523 TaxID=2596709 RepID=A0A7G3KEM3_9CAUD|nr:mRNA metabolism modulator [Enterobacter phage vB_EhoM-IME523]QEA10490.1 mRNA metabolism modulator [Enterobacter phage vB_EhoM-IME523]
MHKLEEGYYYEFSNSVREREFKMKSSGNYDIVKFIGGKPFKVVSIDDDGVVYGIQNHDGDVLGVCWGPRDFAFFKRNFILAWVKGAGYQLVDGRGLLNASAINIQFVREIGYNPFQIVSVENHFGNIKTMRLAYVHPENSQLTKEMNFTLSSNEIQFFEEYVGPLIKGFVRGESCVDVVECRDPVHNMSKICSEIELPTAGWVDEQIEEQEKDRGQTDAEIMTEIARDVAELTPESPKIEVKGKIRFVVEDEITRLKAIEFLNNMVFK